MLCKSLSDNDPTSLVIKHSLLFIIYSPIGHHVEGDYVPCPDDASQQVPSSTPTSSLFFLTLSNSMTMTVSAAAIPTEQHRRDSLTEYGRRGSLAEYERRDSLTTEYDRRSSLTTEYDRQDSLTRHHRRDSLIDNQLNAYTLGHLHVIRSADDKNDAANIAETQNETNPTSVRAQETTDGSTIETSNEDNPKGSKSAANTKEKPKEKPKENHTTNKPPTEKPKDTKPGTSLATATNNHPDSAKKPSTGTAKGNTSDLINAAGGKGGTAGGKTVKEIVTIDDMIKLSQTSGRVNNMSGKTIVSDGREKTNTHAERKKEKLADIYKPSSLPSAKPA